MLKPSRRSIALAVLLAAAALASTGRAETRLLSRWSFGAGDPGANAVQGAPAARVVGATAAKGRAEEGGQGALAFVDWSVIDYLKPDPKKATRVVVEPAGDSTALQPPLPFSVTAWIYPTADPVYYGGILERGRGYNAAYRLVLLRGLVLQASVGPDAVVRSPSPLTLDEWHEVGFKAEGGALALLVDGKEVARAALSATALTASDDPVIIGERYTGRIDEISISAE